jgi:hypothetical protein
VDLERGVGDLEQFGDLIDAWWIRQGLIFVMSA